MVSGYAGRVLTVDLTSGAIGVDELDCVPVLAERGRHDRQVERRQQHLVAAVESEPARHACEPGQISLADGALVAKVEPNSPAWLQGLRPGDIIYAINRRRVRNVNELMAVLRGIEGSLSISLLRGDYRITILIR